MEAAKGSGGPKALIELVDDLLGQELGYLQPPAVELWDTSRQIIYMASLRQLATRRLDRRRSEAEGWNADNWQPDDDEKDLLRLNLHREMGRLAILNNTADWERQRDGSEGLHAHQEDVIDKFLAFLRDSPSPARPDDGMTLQGRLELPTGAGKSFLIQKIADIVGISKPVPYREPLNAIVITSRDALRGQILEGFNDFAPHIDATPVISGYYDEQKAPVEIASYQGITSCHARGRTQVTAYDLTFLDEMHNALGRKVAPNLAGLQDGSLRIGMTASPELTQKDVKHYLPHLIAEGDLLAYIQAGILNSLHIFTHSTGIEFDHKTIAKNEKRNAQIIGLVKDCVEQGLQVYVACKAGNKCEHATILQGLLDGSEIIDRSTGDVRALRAEAVTGYHSSGHTRRVKKLFEQGEVDVILDTKTLNEGFDSNRVGALILAAPTASKAVLIQRLGRGLRKNSLRPVTIVHELRDEIRSEAQYKTKQPYTCHHLLNEPSIKYERFIGPSKMSNFEASPRAVRAGLTPASGMISFITAEKRVPEAPAPGWIRIGDLLSVADRHDLGLRVPQLRYIIDKYSPYTCQIDADGRGTYYVPPGAVDYIRELSLRSYAPKGYSSAKALSVSSDYSEYLIQKTAEQLGITGKLFRRKFFHASTQHFSAEDQQRILSELSKFTHKAEGEYTLEEMYSEIKGASRSSIRTFLATEGFEPTVRRTQSGETHCYDRHAFDMAKEHFKVRAMPEGGVILENIRKKTGIGRTSFYTRIREMGLDSYVAIGQAEQDGKYTSVRYVPSDIGSIIESRLTERSEAGAVPFTRLAVEYKINPTTIFSIVQNQNLAGYVIERATQKSTRRLIMAEALPRLKKLLDAYIEGGQTKRRAIKNGNKKITPETVPVLRPTDEAVALSMDDLAAELGCTASVALKFLNRMQLVESGLVELENGEMQVTAEAVLSAKNFASFLKPAHADWLRLSVVAKQYGMSALQITRTLGRDANYAILFCRVPNTKHHIDQFIDPHHLRRLQKSD